MATLKEYLDYAELAQASYIDEFQKNMFNETYVDKDGNKILLSEFSIDQAENFAVRYEVVDVANPYLSGLDAVLFRDKQNNNKLILSIRGTSSVADLYADVLLAKDGLVKGQMDTLEEFIVDLQSQGVIGATDSIDVTGHSLGGVLAQTFSAKHPELVDKTYTYNSPGIGGLAFEVYETLGISSGSIENVNIINIYAQEAPEVITGLGVLSGSSQNISVDNDSINPLYYHSVSTLTESLYIYNMLSKIANTQNLNLLTSIMKDVKNERVIEVIEKAFSDQQISTDLIDQAIAFTNNNTGKAEGLINLTNQLPAQLNSRDKANLYALLNVNPFSIQGNLPAYETINPADYSDMQLSDRADFLYYNLHQDTVPTDTVYRDYRNGITLGSGINQVIFGSDNESIETITGSSGNDRIYGNAGDDIIHGDSSNAYLTNNGNDYIEGGKGNDIIHGDGGADVILGGADNDILYGNTGEDTLLGGENEDILVGGSGSDTLLGQSGNDVLVGGDSLDDLYSEKNYDYLSGGTGFDTYLVSHQDVINDADHSGLIMFNDKSLSGTKTKVDENSYEDDNFTYTLNSSNMIVVDKNLGEYITIENFNFNSGGIGINFDDGTDDPTKKDVEIYVGDATVTEGGTLEFTVAIDNTLDKDLVLDVESYFSGSADTQDLQTPMNGTITIKAGDTSATFTIDTVDDAIVEPTENFIFAVTGYKYTGEDTNSILIKNAGEGTITDNDKKTDKEIDISIGSGSRYEAGSEIAFTVSISEALDEDISVGYEATSAGNSLVAGSYNVTILKGETSAELIVPITDDDIEESDEAISLSYVGFGYNGSDIKNVTGTDGSGTILNDDFENGEGHQTPYDPTTPGMSDPLVLDSDKDGFISTISLDDSSAYFDLTGDGVKEKVGWISPNDGILAYDKDDNGNISGIDEVFGSGKVSGFTELRELADSNYDGVIDRKDELYSRLKVWHDVNGDGTSQADELISLKDEGVTSINLNAITTNIELGGATLTEASKYTDSEGNKELAADVNLEYDARLTTIDTTTIPDYSVDLDTLTLPNLRGYGLFLNSFISYNINDALKQKAQELVANPASMGDGFDKFLEIWSGYTKYVNGVKEKLNITGEIGLGELDKKVWIMEKLFNENSKSTPIENRFEQEMKKYENSSVDSVTSSNVTIAFQEDYYNNYFQKELLDRYEGAFALQAFYKFDGAHYDVNRAKYVVDDLEVFNADVAEYLNSVDNSYSNNSIFTNKKVA